ncbi:MAG: T9SS type A sorting domain-containing protein [Bacteroidota bacterium]
MKKLFFLLCFLEPFILNAQPYYPMLKENKFWDEQYSSLPSFCNVDGGRRYFVYGDTIINTVTYKKIYGHSMGSYVGNPFCPPFYFNNDGLLYPPAAILREDTSQRKVFIWDNNTEYVLWDFSLNVGDTLYAGYHYPIDFVVDSVGLYPLSNGNLRRAIYLDSFGDPFCVEEVGGFFTMFFPQYGPVWLNCVKNNGEKIWGGSCYNFLSIDEIEKPGINYYINENNYLIVSGSEIISRIGLFNAQGSQIFSSVINNINTSVNLQQISNGLYILQFTLTDGSLLSFKVIL